MAAFIRLLLLFPIFAILPVCSVGCASTRVTEAVNLKGERVGFPDFQFARNTQTPDAGLFPGRFEICETDPPVSPRSIRASDELDSASTQAVSLGVPEPIFAEQQRVATDCAGVATPDWRSDKADFLEVFCRDVEALCSRENAVTLLVAGGVSFALHETLDDDVARDTADHPNRWGKIQDVIGGMGNPLHHLAAASGIYAYSLVKEDVELHDFSRALFNATAITTVSTTILKYAANTGRPNGDSHGWPSGHTASSVAVAAVLDEYYGHWIGIPAYALSGLVAWERIDDREHDLSDVAFGAALGYVIGRTVASRHHAEFCGLQVEPYTDPATGASGVALERHF